MQWEEDLTKLTHIDNFLLTTAVGYLWWHSRLPFFKIMTQNPPLSHYEQKGIVRLPSAVLTALHTQATLNSISFDEQVPTVQSQQR